MGSATRNTIAAGLAVIGLALAVPLVAQTGPPLGRDGQSGPRLWPLHVANAQPPQSDQPGGQPAMQDMPQGIAENIGPGSGVTFEQLQDLALNRHPALVRAAAQVDAARGRWIQAGLRPNPNFGYSSEEIGNNGTAGIHGVFASREFITAGKLGLAQSRAGAEVQAAQEAWRTTQTRVLADVRIAYINALVAQERLRLAEELLAIADDGVRIALELERVEENSPADRMQAQNEANGAAILVNNARAELDGAWRLLSVSTGGQPLNPEPLAGTLEGNIPQLEWYGTLERLFAESPLLANADAQINAARWNIERQAVEPIPNVNTQAGIGYATATDSVVGRVQVSIAIPVNDANQGAVLAARASLTAAQRERERIMLRIEQRLASVFAQYVAASRQVEEYERPNGILPLADNVLKLRIVAYQQGEVDYTAVLTAQTTLFRFKQQYLQSLQDAHLAAARIEFLLLEDALSQ